MNVKNIIPFEVYINKILKKDPSKVLSELFPRLSHPSQSRFHEFFKKLKELNLQEKNEKKLNKIQYKKNKKKMKKN